MAGAVARANPRVRRVRPGQTLRIPASPVQPQSYRKPSFAMPSSLQMQVGQQQAGWGSSLPGALPRVSPISAMPSPPQPYVPQRWGSNFVRGGMTGPVQNVRPTRPVAPQQTPVTYAPSGLPQGLQQQIGQQQAGWTGPNAPIPQMSARQQMIMRLQQNRASMTPQDRINQAGRAMGLMQQYEPVPPGMMIRGRGQTYAQQLLDMSRSASGEPNSKYGELMRMIYEQQPNVEVLLENGVLPNLMTPAEVQQMYRLLVERGSMPADYTYEEFEQALVGEGFIRDEYGIWYNQNPKDLTKYIEQGGGSGGSSRPRTYSRSYGGGRYASSGRSGGQGYMAGTQQYAFNPSLLGLTSWRI